MADADLHSAAALQTYSHITWSGLVWPQDDAHLPPAIARQLTTSFLRRAESWLALDSSTQRWELLLAVGPAPPASPTASGPPPPPATLLTLMSILRWVLGTRVLLRHHSTPPPGVAGLWCPRSSFTACVAPSHAGDAARAGAPGWVPPPSHGSPGHTLSWTPGSSICGPWSSWAGPLRPDPPDSRPPVPLYCDAQPPEPSGAHLSLLSRPPAVVPESLVLVALPIGITITAPVGLFPAAARRLLDSLFPPPAAYRAADLSVDPSPHDDVPTDAWDLATGSSSSGESPSVQSGSASDAPAYAI